MSVRQIQLPRIHLEKRKWKTMQQKKSNPKKRQIVMCKNRTEDFLKYLRLLHNFLKSAQLEYTNRMKYLVVIIQLEPELEQPIRLNYPESNTSALDWWKDILGKLLGLPELYQSVVKLMHPYCDSQSSRKSANCKRARHNIYLRIIDAMYTCVSRENCCF